MLAAAFAYFALDGVPDRLGVAGLNFLLQFGLGSFVFALIAVGGIANAINIVDGYNGLSGVLVVFILGAMAYVAFLVGDSFILDTCLTLMGAIVGFLVWNFPRGKIFLGDGGAYFIGFMIGELSVLLVRPLPLPALRNLVARAGREDRGAHGGAGVCGTGGVLGRG